MNDALRDVLIKASTVTKKLDFQTVTDTQSHVRFYFSSPDTCGLQIRARGPIVDGGKTFDTFSHATLKLDGAKELREALDRWIKEKEGKSKPKTLETIPKP